jgi:hypothetical protein
MKYNIRLRLLVYKLFGIYLYLLRRLVKGLGGQIEIEEYKELITIRHNIMLRNLEYQKQYRLLFNKYYHLCPNCYGCCWSHEKTPYDEVDILLYGLPKDLIVRHTSGTLSILRGLIKPTLSGSKNHHSKSEIPKQNLCESLRGDGCVLPWGERVANCTLYLCQPFAANMTNTDFLSYFWLSITYLSHLTRSSVQILAYIAYRRIV